MALPEPQDKPLNYAEQAVIDAYLKLGNVSQRAVARYMGKSEATVRHHLAKQRTVSGLTQAKAAQSDKSRGIIARAQRAVNACSKLLAAALEGPKCAHCQRQPITIPELAVLSRTGTDLLKTMLDLRSQHGLGETDPSDPQQLRMERTRDRARVVKLARALVKQYKPRLTGPWRDPADPG